MGFRALLALCLLTFATGAVQGSVLVTLDNSTETGVPGQTLTFSGIITNQDSVNAIELDALNGSVDSPLTLDTSPSDAIFLAGLMIPAGGTSADITLFDIIIPSTGVAVPATYNGSFTLEDNNSDVVGGSTFAVDTVNTVPEASTLSALTLGIAGFLALRRRMRRLS